MFILYAVVAGLVAGKILGGRLSGLATVKLRWPALAIAGLASQLVLFSPAVTRSIGDAGPPLYVASTALVLLFVLRNARIAGFPLVAVGAFSNLIAIVANGGYMSASPAALEAAGLGSIEGYSNSRVVADPAVPLLTDIFAIPREVPLANVFSVGDVLIGVGIAVAIAWSMRRLGAPPFRQARRLPWWRRAWPLTRASTPAR